MKFNNKYYKLAALSILSISIGMVTLSLITSIFSDSFHKRFIEYPSPLPTQLSQENVNTIPEQITVMIDGPGDDEKSKGSGVIVRREGNIYYVLTNRHVVEKDGDYKVQTEDRKRYVVNYRQIQKLPGLDLAVLQFSSNQHYRVATLGDSDQVFRRQKIYVVGYATPGVVFPSRPFIPAEGMILDRVQPSKDGYALVYYLNIIQPGMSGGPVLDEQGRLIGINGLAQPDERTGRTDLIAGIPSNTFRDRLVAIVPMPNQPLSILIESIPKANSQKFYCGMNQGQPAILVRTPRSTRTLIILKNPDLISGWSPQRRCNEISARLEKFSDENSSLYITSGTVGDRPVICATSSIGSHCSLSNVLIPLSPGTDAHSVLEKLFNLNHENSSILYL